jgi:putative FmdB family regulatory protein
MPFYEYECQACKFYTEVMQKISEAPLTKCPSCGKPKLKKLVSAPVFRLKGGGWYETDFKSDKENRRNLLGPEKEEPKAEKADKVEGKEGKPEARDAKEAKESKEAKPAEPKGAAPKSAPAAKPAAARRTARRTAKATPRRGARRRGR